MASHRARAFLSNVEDDTPTSLDDRQWRSQRVTIPWLTYTTVLSLSIAMMTIISLIIGFVIVGDVQTIISKIDSPEWSVIQSNKANQSELFVQQPQMLQPAVPKAEPGGQIKIPEEPASTGPLEPVNVIASPEPAVPTTRPTTLFESIQISRPDYDSVSILNSSNIITSELKTVNPTFMVLNPTRSSITYVTSWNSNQGHVRIAMGGLFIFDLRLPNNIIPLDIVAHPSGNVLYVSSGQGSVSQYTNRIIVVNVTNKGQHLYYYREVVFGSYLQRMDITPDGDYLFVTDGSNPIVHVLDTRSLTIVRNVSTNGLTMGFVKHIPLMNLTILSGGSNDTILFVDTWLGTLITELIIPKGQLGNVVGMGYDDSQDRLYIPNGIDTLYAYDLTTVTQPLMVSSYLVGMIPGHALVVGSVIYIANVLDNSLSIIDGNTTTTISFGPRMIHGIGPLCLLLVR